MGAPVKKVDAGGLAAIVIAILNNTGFGFIPNGRWVSNVPLLPIFFAIRRFFLASRETACAKSI